MTTDTVPYEVYEKDTDAVKVLELRRLLKQEQTHTAYLHNRHQADRELICDLVAITSRVADMLMTDLDQAE